MVCMYYFIQGFGVLGQPIISGNGTSSMNVNMNKTTSSFNNNGVNNPLSNTLKSNRTQSNFFSAKDKVLMEKSDGFSEFKRAESTSKLGSGKTGKHRKSYSNWRNSELKEKLPELLTTIRSNTLKDIFLYF